jgi:hypothetical protein
MPAEHNQPRQGWYRIDWSLLSRTDLTSDEKLILAVMADGYRISVRSVSERVGLSRSKTGRIMSALAARGFVTVSQKRKGGKGFWAVTSDCNSPQSVPPHGTLSEAPENGASHRMGRHRPTAWDAKRPTAWDAITRTSTTQTHGDVFATQSTALCETGSANLRNRAKTGHVHLRDLTDNERLLAVFARAAKAGFVPQSEHGRFMIFALAECCMRAGKAPAAMFAAMIARREFWRVSIGDEDQARVRLRAIDEAEVSHLRKARVQ